METFVQKSKKLTAALAAMFFLVFLQCSTAQAESKLNEINLVSEEWENSVQADGSGIYLDILHLIYDPLGIKVNCDITDYARSVALVKQGKKDAWLGSYIDEEEDVIYPKWHFDADVVAVIYKKKLGFQWQGEKSLAGKNVGWIKGYNYNDYIETKFKNKEFKTREKGLKLLEIGRLDFFLDDQRELELAVEKGNVNADEFEYKTLMNLNIYPAFANNERGQALQKIYDEGFAKLLKAGEIKKLYKKWNDPIYPF